jgi:hypothetical protein
MAKSFLDGPKTESIGVNEGCKAAGFPFASPFRLEKEFSRIFPSLAKVAREKKLNMKSDGKRLIGSTGANLPRTECIVDPVGFRICEYRQFDEDGNAVIEMRAKWRKVGDEWYVKSLEQSLMPFPPNGRKERSSCSILYFRPNVEIDSAVFERPALATPLDPSPLPIVDEPAAE